MRVMVIDTALGLCTAGVFEAEPVLKSLGLRSEAMSKGHHERLGGMARDAAAEASGLKGLDRIGVTVGPGSFTGLRVGLAFAHGLGAALDLPVVGLSSLDALAASVEDANVAALIDARRGQVYARFWREGRAEGPPEPLSIEAARRRLTAFDRDLTLVGSGAPLVADAAPQARIVDLVGPDPWALARLAAAADPARSEARPLYLRAPDATPPSRMPGQPRQPAT